MFDRHIYNRTRYITKTEHVPYEKTININKPSTVEDLEFLQKQRDCIIEEYLGSTITKLSGIFNVEVLISKFEDPSTLDNIYHVSFKSTDGILRDKVIIRQDSNEEIINNLMDKINKMMMSQISIPCLEFLR